MDRLPPDLPYGAAPIPVIRAQQDPVHRVKDAGSTLEFILGLLQPEFTRRPDGTPPGLADRARLWNDFSQPEAVMNAVQVRNDLTHPGYRTTTDALKRAANDLLQALEEAVSAGAARPRLADVAAQLRGGPSVARAEIRCEGVSPDRQENTFGITITARFYVSGMRDEEGRIAPRFFAESDGRPLPAFATSLPISERFVQQRAGYHGTRRLFVPYAYLHSGIGKRALRCQLAISRRASAQSSWTDIARTEFPLLICVPGAHVFVNPVPQYIDAKGRRGLLLRAEGTVAGMQGGSYYVGAWFFDGNGDTMYWVLGPDGSVSIRPVSFGIERPINADVCAVRWDGFMPYEDLPPCHHPPCVCHLKVLVRGIPRPPCRVIGTVILSDDPRAAYWELWRSDDIKFTI